MQINLNRQIRFTPTDYAHSVYYKYHLDLFNLQLPKDVSGTMLVGPDGTVTMTLHSFMHIFGPVLYVGNPEIVSEANQIELIHEA